MTHKLYSEPFHYFDLISILHTVFELAHYMHFTRHIRTNCISASVTSNLVQRAKDRVRGNLTQSYHMTQGI